MKSFLLPFFCLMLMSSSAQTKSNYVATNQSFFAEVGGPGILFSANYDRRFSKTAFGLGFRAGLGFVTVYEYETYVNPNGYIYAQDRRRSVLTIPVQVNYILGKSTSSSALEVGLGATLTGRKINVFDNYYDYNKDKSSLYGTASFMYRRMPKEGGFSWRVGFTPVFTNGYIQASGGASVGYNF